MLNLHQPDGMRAGTPAHPGRAWFSHAACRSKRCERHSPRRRALLRIAEGFSPTTACGAYRIKRSISFRSPRGMRDSGSVQLHSSASTPPAPAEACNVFHYVLFKSGTGRAVTLERWNGRRYDSTCTGFRSRPGFLLPDAQFSACTAGAIRCAKCLMKRAVARGRSRCGR